jgi:glycosyltransferase involved in cell wall biosynthesis
MTRRPVAMLAHSYYEEDPRVRREAETLVASGRDVDVFALRQPGQPADAELDGVRVHRLDVQRHQGSGLRTYLAEYVAFFARAAFALARAQRRRRYGLVQVHTLPDFLAFAALPLRLRGIPILLDLHEASPEFFRDRYPRAPRLVGTALDIQERAAIAAASAVITANEALGRRLVQLGVPEAKVTVVRNSPSLARFDPTRHPQRAFMADGVLCVVYAGALSATYEVDVAIAAIARLRQERQDLLVRFEIYGRDYGERPLVAQVAGLGLGDVVTFHGRIPIEDVPAAIAAADIGLSPTARSPFTDLSLSTKILEYGAMGVPVVASRLPTVAAAFGDGELVLYEPGDPASLAAAILDIVDHPKKRNARVKAMQARAGELAWERESGRYLGLVERLARDP